MHSGEGIQYNADFYPKTVKLYSKEKLHFWILLNIVEVTPIYTIFPKH
jgi:hypothetical protein